MLLRFRESGAVGAAIYVGRGGLRRTPTLGIRAAADSLRWCVRVGHELEEGDNADRWA